ncbi:MAG: hypothetical protein WC797_03840 [Candidatus Paceibacterota bacterium]|jgi:hypothetical protein
MTKRAVPFLVGLSVFVFVSWAIGSFAGGLYFETVCCNGDPPCWHKPAHEATVKWSLCEHKPYHNYDNAEIILLGGLAFLLLPAGLSIFTAQRVDKLLLVHIPAKTAFVDVRPIGGEVRAFIDADYPEGAILWKHGKEWKYIKDRIALPYGYDEIPCTTMSFDNGPVRLRINVVFPHTPKCAVAFYLSSYKSLTPESWAKKTFFDFVYGFTSNRFAERWNNPADAEQCREFRDTVREYFHARLPEEYTESELGGRVLVVASLEVNKDMVSIYPNDGHTYSRICL